MKKTVKETLGRLKNKTVDKVERVGLMLTTAGTAIAFPGTAHAAMGESSSAESIVSSSIDAIVNLVPFIGVGFLLIGAVKVIQGFQNDNNPEAISSGIKNLVVGAALVAFRVFIWNSIKSAIGL